MIHELKIHPDYFNMIMSGIKNFEVRKDDRHFNVGDELLLKEFIPKGFFKVPQDEEYYTNRILHRRVDYILRGGQFGIEEGYVVMSISKI